MRNIELKARLHDLAAARRTAVKIATKQLGTQHQIDTFFRCHEGRLKLRQIDGLRAELIWYQRDDQEEAKASDYVLVPTAQPETLKTALDAALGIRTVVEKKREIFLYYNVRIHLDEVVGLGTFLEFEAVLGSDIDDRMGQEQVAELSATFAIEDDDLLAVSYADMLESGTP